MFVLFFSVVNLSLKDAVALVDSNYDVKIKKLEVKSALNELYKSAGNFLPVVEVNGNYTYLSEINTITTAVLDSLVMVRPGVFVPVTHEEVMELGKHDNYTLMFSLKQPLFTWGRIFNTMRISKLSYNGKKLEDSLIRLTLQETVKELYIYALMADYFIELQEKIDYDLKEHYTTAKERFSAGYITEMELLQAEAAYNSSLGGILDAKNKKDKLLNTIKTLLDIDLDKDLVLTDELNEDLVSISTQFQEPLNIKILKNNEKILNIKKSIVLFQNLPSLFANLSYQYKDPYGMDGLSETFWSFTIAMNMKLFNQGKTYLDYVNTNIKKKEVVFLEKKNELALEAKLNEIKNEIEYRKKMLAYSKEQLKTAEKLLGLSKRLYNEGSATHIEFMDAEMNYVKAKVGYIQNIGSYLLSLINYEKAARTGIVQ